LLVFRYLILYATNTTKHGLIAVIGVGSSGVVAHIIGGGPVGVGGVLRSSPPVAVGVDNDSVGAI